MSPSLTRHPRQGRGRASMRECRRLLAALVRAATASRSTASTVEHRRMARQGTDPHGAYSSQQSNSACC